MITKEDVLITIGHLSYTIGNQSKELATLHAEVKTMQNHLATASSHIAELLVQNATLQVDLDAANAKLAAVPAPVADEPVAVRREAKGYTDFGTYPPLPEGVEIGEGCRQLALGEILEPGDERLMSVDDFNGQTFVFEWKTIHYLHAGNKCYDIYRRKVKATGPVIHDTPTLNN